MARISVPTSGRLQSSLRVDASHPAVSKILGRLSRASLLSVALDWLDENNQVFAAPYLRDDDDSEEDNEDDFHPPARSLEALQEVYTELQARKGPKREVLDRIIEGDWRHGLSLYQLAMADLQYLYDHPLSQKWTAYRVVPLKPRDPNADANDEPPVQDKESLVIPRFHPSTFLNALQTQVPPDVKAHYNLDRHRTLPMLLLRIFILDSPYNTSLGLGSTTAAFDASRTVYIAFPDGSPHVFISKPQSTTAAAAGGSGGESKSLTALIVEGIPKALSRPRERVTIKPTNLTTRNLAEMIERKGAQRTNNAGGGWSIYTEDKNCLQSPLDLALPTPPLSEEEVGGKGKKRGMALSADERAAKRRKLVARARFGNTAKVDDGLGVERLDIVIQDAFPTGDKKREQRQPDSEDSEDEDGEADPEQRASKGRKNRAEAGNDKEKEADRDEEEEEEWRPYVRLTFHGSHVFAGIRQLVEHGIIDGERMPGWMTGQEGVTVGAVRHGRIRGNKGSGA
ncbi:CHL4-domain-containing protein [Echria macrotheca]|uniref:CHL4-domain-containing protein n=1 Tax=Echria macrotheca TaxID=438768 RepID=A0AAJ0BNJ4_9PEZI|nr:CHL4-domain-containing protein [Echria macrotheca]